MNEQSFTELIIYNSTASIMDQNAALVFIRKQAARIAELEAMNAEYQKAIRYASFPVVLNYGGVK